MNNEHAKPGDTIEITDISPQNSSLLGQKFLVMECPDDKKDGPLSEYAWIKYKGFLSTIDNPDTYKIVDRRLIASNDVDASLKRRLNDNLRDLFT